MVDVIHNPGPDASKRTQTIIISNWETVLIVYLHQKIECVHKTMSSGSADLLPRKTVVGLIIMSLVQ